MSALLKYKGNAKQWRTLYADALNNRLRRDLNLSDLFDAAIARINIGISGAIAYDHDNPDNPEYHHHPVYKDWIDAAADKAAADLANEEDARIRADELEADIRQQKIDDLKDYTDEKLIDLREDMEVLINQETKIRQLQVDNVRLEAQNDLLLKAAEIYNKMYTIQQSLSDDIKTEARQRYEEDNRLRNDYIDRINSEETDRKQAILDEKEQRQIDDLALGARIEGTNRLLEQERQDRATQDVEHDYQINHIRTVEIPAEAAARKAEDDMIKDFIHAEGGKAKYGNLALREDIDAHWTSNQNALTNLRDFVNYGSNNENRAANYYTRRLSLFWNSIWDSSTTHNTTASSTTDSYPNAYSIYKMIQEIRLWNGWSSGTANTDATRKAKWGNETLYNYIWSGSYTNTTFPGSKMTIEKMLENIRTYTAMGGGSNDATTYANSATVEQKWGNRSLYKQVWNNNVASSTTAKLTVPKNSSNDTDMSIYEMIQGIRKFINYSGDPDTSGNQNKLLESSYSVYGNLAMYVSLFGSENEEGWISQLIKNYKAWDNKIREFIGMSTVANTSSMTPTDDNASKAKWGNVELYRYLWGTGVNTSTPADSSIYNMIQRLREYTGYGARSNGTNYTTTTIDDYPRIRYSNEALYKFIWGSTTSYTLNSLPKQIGGSANSSMYNMLEDVGNFLGITKASMNPVAYTADHKTHYGNVELFSMLFGNKASNSTALAKYTKTIANGGLKTELMQDSKDWDDKIRDFIGMKTIANAGISGVTAATATNGLDATSKNKYGNETLYKYIWGTANKTNSYQYNLWDMIKKIGAYTNMNTDSGNFSSTTDSNTSEYGNKAIHDKLLGYLFGTGKGTWVAGNNTIGNTNIWDFLMTLLRALGGEIKDGIPTINDKYKITTVITNIQGQLNTIANALKQILEKLRDTFTSTLWSGYQTVTKTDTTFGTLTYYQAPTSTQAVFNGTGALQFPNKDTFWIS